MQLSWMSMSVRDRDPMYVVRLETKKTGSSKWKSRIFLLVIFWQNAEAQGFGLMTQRQRYSQCWVVFQIQVFENWNTFWKCNLYLYLKYMLMYLYFVFQAKNTKYILISDIFRQWASTSSAVTLSWLLLASKFWQLQIYLHVCATIPCQNGLSDGSSEKLLLLRQNNVA